MDQAERTPTGHPRRTGDGRLSAILGVSINGDDVRMAIADAPMSGDPAAYGGRGVRRRAVEEFDASVLLDGVAPYGTPEEQVAYALRALFDGSAQPRTERQIRSVVFAYHDADQAKRITMGTDAAGLRHYSLVPGPVAALAELMATRQVGFARHVAVCNVDTWRYSCGIVGADGAMVGEIQRVSTDKLAAADVDVLEGLAMVADAAQQLSGVWADLVVVVGERVEEQFDAEMVERELGLPVIIPAHPEQLVARGASLLPSRAAAGAAGMGSASEGDWAPVAERARRGPDWTSSAAALAGIVGLLLLAGLVVGAFAASGVLSTGDTASSTVAPQIPTSPAEPSPASTTRPPTTPKPEPTTTVAPQAPVSPAPAPPLTPEQQQQQAPPPAPAPEPEPAPAPEPQPQTQPQQQAPAPQAPVQQAPAPAPPPVIEIPGLPPIQLPQIPGL